jgi:hypothetical protein
MADEKSRTNRGYAEAGMNNEERGPCPSQQGLLQLPSDMTGKPPLPDLKCAASLSKGKTCLVESTVIS